MTSITIENGKRNGTSGQVVHRVLDGDEQIGTLYNNRECEAMQNAGRYAFLPRSGRGFSVWLDHPQRDYLDHARGVRSDDRDDIVERIAAWREACIAERARITGEFRAVLDALPEIEHEVRFPGGFDSYDELDGVRCKALGGEKMESAEVELSWAEAAKMIAHSYDECSGWQMLDIRFGPRRYTWALEWRYLRGGDTINLETYGRSAILVAQRSEAHKTTDRAAA